MAGTRRRHAAAFKAKVALEAAKQTKTVAELAKIYRVHPVQISQWKKQLLDGVEELFRDGRRREREESEARQAELYEQIGRLNMEIECLKKPRMANLAEAEDVERRWESVPGGP
jgi:putative transposase